MCAKIVDNWCNPGTPLLPASLRSRWSSEKLPDWMAAGNRQGTTIAGLDASYWCRRGAQANSRLRNFLLNLVFSRRPEIRSLRVFVDGWPYWLDPREIQFSTRTMNCLERSGYLSDPQSLSAVTFGQLFEISGMGVVSVLEFSCLAEVEMEKLESVDSRPEPSDDLSDLLLGIVDETWPHQVGPEDPRFTDLLPRTSGTVFERIEALTSDPDTNELELRNMAAKIPQLEERVEWINTLSLEQALEHLLVKLSRFEGAKLAAMLDRLGWSGSPEITLEEAGSRIGVTRERIRQLQKRIEDKLRGIPFQLYMPTLDAGLTLLQQQAPLSMDEAATLLSDHGPASRRFDPISLIKAARLFHRKPPIQSQRIRGRTIIVTSDIPDADEIIRTAYHQAGASGASNVQEVVAELFSRGRELQEKDVRGALAKSSDAEFLENDWFCHRNAKPHRDRLRNVSRKILAVAQPVSLTAMREGVRREYRYRAFRGVRAWPLVVPPRSVLSRYYAGHPEFIVEGDGQIRAAEPLDYRAELALNERILVDALRLTPACVLDRASLWRACTKHHMNESTFGLYLSYSPVIAHVGIDIWSLRGVHVDPAAIEAVRVANALRPKAKRLVDHGWDDDGQLWLAARLPELQSSFVVGIPSAIRQYVLGREFPAHDEYGENFGTVRVNQEGVSYGFGSFLRQRGADKDDILFISFDLVDCKATLRIGDDESLEELSPES